MLAEESRLGEFAALPADEREAALEELSKQTGLPLSEVKEALARSWAVIGRPKQQPPAGAWTYWAIIAGRGFGKTLTAAQWIKRKALSAPARRIALIAPTIADVRDTMVEGETGVLSILHPESLRGGSRVRAWNRSLSELYLANGTQMKGFSSEVPDRIRGPQHHYFWAEEFSSWDDAKEGNAVGTTWSNATLGCRLGAEPQGVLTSTPKPNRLTKDVLALASVAVVKGSSYENRANLSEAWWQQVVAPLEGTRTGRQEIHAELLEDVEGALWTLGLLEQRRVREAPALSRIVVGVDPNASSSEAANSAGIIVAGSDSGSRTTRRGYVLADRTTTRGGPRAWAQAAVDAYHDFEADRIVAEKNNGGEMVEIMLKTVDPTVPVKLVHASRGKRTRAEPVAALYEGSETVPGRVFHVGRFPELEDEMTTWTPESDSPDRMDACVWTMTELLLGGAGAPLRVLATKGRIDDALPARGYY